jgi:energy-coupling factor transporter ATP-binding protein EcfA2
MADEHFLENALEAFRSKKVIVIFGPRGSGKTTLALSLLSSYQDGHYLILTEPDDLSCIGFGVTCVVIIEDLGGKYSFEMSVIQKWLRKFDMLYSAIKDGKLNVIITCLTDRLSLCVHESKHPMLETVIELPKDCSVEIKKESSTGSYEMLYNLAVYFLIIVLNFPNICFNIDS